MSGPYPRGYVRPPAGVRGPSPMRKYYVTIGVFIAGILFLLRAWVIDGFGYVIFGPTVALSILFITIMVIVPIFMFRRG